MSDIFLQDQQMMDRRRLDSLRRTGILDTFSEDDYDEITDMVSTILGIPFCLISFVDNDRLWFKSCQGMDVQEMPREPSFCNDAIKSDDIFIVPDALEDDRFKQFPFVVNSPGIRFYAGMPLRSSEGYAWGVLCVLDTQPRDFNEVQIKTLRYFAQQVVQLVEQRASRLELEDTTHWARSIVDHILDGIIIMDNKGYTQSMNPAAERIFGYAVDEVKNEHVSKLIPDTFKCQCTRDALDSHQDHQPIPVCFHGETCGRHKHGREIQVELSVNDFTFQGKKMFTAICRDMTAKVAAESTMRRAFALLDGTLDGIFMFHPETLIFSYVNKGAVLQTGYTEEELLKMSPLDIKPAFDEKKYRDMLKPLISNETSALKYTTIHQCKNGEEIPVEIILQHLEDSIQQSQLIAIVRDITERIKVEEENKRLHSNLELLVKERTEALEQSNQELRDSKERFRTLFEGNLDGIVLGGAQMEFILCNGEFENMSGYTREELLKIRYLNKLVHPDDRARLLKNNQRRLKGEAIEERYEFRLVTKSGQVRHVDACFNLAKFGEQILGIQGVFRDISERKKAEEALRKLNQELEQRVEERTRDLEEARNLAVKANHAKSDFLSRMSHEVRTPLSGILGFSKLLEMDNLNDIASKNARRIRAAGEHLLELVEEVLDISRIESGNLSLSFQPVDLVALTQEVIDLVETLSNSNRISISFEDQTESKALVWADHKRLRQVLFNLASNGIKFNQKDGSLSFIIKSFPDDRLRLEVRDTGIGIPSEKMDRLFAPFERLDAEKRHPSIPGTGLGLALCKVLMESMNGSIAVSSSEGEGSVFALEMMREKAEMDVGFEDGKEGSDRYASASSEQLQPLKILYIEDNEDNLELFGQVVQLSHHAKLLTAITGKHGLQLATEHQPDIVFLDFHLPDCEGDEVLTQLKKHPQTRGIPVYMLSADGRNDQIQRLKKLGAVDYLVKPFDIERLLEILHSQASSHS